MGREQTDKPTDKAVVDEGREHDGWHDAGLTLDMALDDLLTAKTPVDFAEAVIKVSNARSDLRTFLPGYDYNTHTLPWERHVD